MLKIKDCYQWICILFLIVTSQYILLDLLLLSRLRLSLCFSVAVSEFDLKKSFVPRLLMHDKTCKKFLFYVNVHV